MGKGFQDPQGRTPCSPGHRLTHSSSEQKGQSVSLQWLCCLSTTLGPRTPPPSAKNSPPVSVSEVFKGSFRHREGSRGNNVSHYDARGGDIVMLTSSKKEKAEGKGQFLTVKWKFYLFYEVIMRSKGDKGREIFFFKLCLMFIKHLLTVRGFKRKIIWISRIS